MHLRVLVLGILIMLLDGYDIAALGFVVPALAKDWGLPASSFGPALSASLLGAALGSVLAGAWGDRHGRRQALLASFLVGGVASLLTALCETRWQLSGCRFLTGIGMGGTIPNTIALVSEFMPRARRSFLIVLVYCTAALGASVGSLLASRLLPWAGWPAVFGVGGVAPLAVGLVAWRWLPESLQFLATCPDRRDEARSVAAALGASVPDDAVLVARKTVTGESSRQNVFGPGWRTITALLWVIFVGTQALVFFMAGWYTTLLTGAGMPMAQALVNLSLLHFGALFGGLSLAWLSDRRSPEGPLAATYLAAAGTLLLLAWRIGGGESIRVLSLLAGATIIGASFCLGAFAARCYPPPMRAAGLGWGLGVGRVGSVSSPLLGGFALAAGISGSALFGIAAAPAAVCAGVVVVLAGVRRRSMVS